MRVLFDISAVGGSTGLNRVTRELALAFAARRDVDVAFCATGSLQGVAGAADFLRDHPSFDGSGMTGLTLAAGAAWLNHIGRDGSRLGKSPMLQRLGQSCGQMTLRALNLARPKTPRGLLRSIDVFHSPYGRLTRQIKNAHNVQRFLTIHDVLPTIMPECFTTGQRAVFDRILASIGPRDWAICVSERTRDDLCRLTKLRRDQTFVAPLAASPERFAPCLSADIRAAVRARYGIPAGPYLLSLASLEPRKNLTFLVRVFARLARESRQGDLHLVLAGSRGWKFDELLDAVDSLDGLRGRVHLIGHVAEADLSPLYSDALAFVYPSLYEGFGLPPLEAMQCGTPVIVSNTSSLTEVVGDAGLLVGPRDEDAWRNALESVYLDASLRARLAAQSLRQAARFSWDQCVDTHLAAYRHALAAR